MKKFKKSNKKQHINIIIIENKKRHKKYEQTNK